jgi:hypothetical protein
MKHDWQYTDGKELFVECPQCGLCYALHKTRPTHGCKGSYVGDNNRQEPSEEILRALGHGLTTQEDV